MNYLQVLRHTTFRNLWLGQLISQLGDAFYVIVFPFMVRKITGSAENVALIAVMEGLPYLLIGPYAGVIADRIDRRKIMLACDLLSFGLLFIFGLSFLFFGPPTLPSLLITASLLSVINAFFSPAKSAAIPSAVPLYELNNALSLSASTQNTSSFIGMGLFGITIGILEKLPQSAFFTSICICNSLTFLGSAYFIYKLPSLKPLVNKLSPKHALEESYEGLKYIWSNRMLRTALIVTLLYNLFSSPFMVLYIEVNELWFEGNMRSLSQIEAAYAGALVLGSILIGKYPVYKPGLSFSIGLFITGSVIMLMGTSQNFLFFFILNVIFGLGFPITTIPLNNYIQMSVDHSYLGRVNSALTMTTLGIMPFGICIAGLGIKPLGLSNLFYMMGAGLIFTGLYAFLHRSFRKCHI